MHFLCVNNAVGTMEGFAIIKSAEEKISARGTAYLDLIIADSSGEMSAKLWDFSPEMQGRFHAHDVVKLRGTYNAYNGTTQFKIERIRLVTNTDDVAMESLIASAPRTGEDMFDEIHAVAEAFSDDDYRALVLRMLDENKERLLYWPGAHKLHHAVRGGLLWHTLSVLRLAIAVAALYDGINSDLLYAGAILHDIAKLDEYIVPSIGISSGYSTKGQLLGHLVMGAIAVDQKCAELGIPEQKRTLLEHMLISHHGVPEFGAAKEPAFLEAYLLSQLDNLDAGINEIQQALEGVKQGEFSPSIWALDKRKMFQHGTAE
ncbi:MAG: HD domain-containing protein [Oscillospiraceae bacterium]|nr:HD domain-containing protein [Oscillospiraceae bacterium]